MSKPLALIEADRILRQAGDAFQQGQYAKATRGFSQIAHSGVWDVNDPVQAVRHQAYAWQGLGDIARALADYAQARRHLERGLRLLRNEIGAGDLAEAYLLNSLGMVGKYSGRFDEGTRHYLRALKYVRPGRGPAIDADLEATLYHNLGGIEFSRGRYRQALPYARKSVVLRRKLCGARHPVVAADESALGGVLDGLGRFKESRPIYERNIRLWKRLGKAHDYDRAIDINNLGAIHLDEGRVAKAITCFEEGLKIQVRLFGSGHPDVAYLKHNLGVAYGRNGNGARARALLRAALTVFRRRLGDKHPATRGCREAIRNLGA